MSLNLIGRSVHVEAGFAPSRELIAAHNQEQSCNYVQSLQKLLVNNSQHFHVLHWVDECVRVANFYQGLSGMLMITLGAR